MLISKCGAHLNISTTHLVCVFVCMSNGDLKCEQIKLKLALSYDWPTLTKGSVLDEFIDVYISGIEV